MDKNQTKLQVIERPLKELTPAPYNPRGMTEEAYAGLKESIKKFGLLDPLIENTRTGFLVGGHQRLRALKELGFTTASVVQVDLAPNVEKALNVTLNNPRISGHFTDSLQDLLEEIEVDLGQSMADLRLNELAIPDNWDSGTEQVEETEENLDGITAKIVIKCPQDIADEVRIYVQRKLLETSFAGVTLA